MIQKSLSLIKVLHDSLESCKTFDMFIYKNCNYKDVCFTTNHNLGYYSDVAINSFEDAVANFNLVAYSDLIYLADIDNEIYVSRSENYNPVVTRRITKQITEDFIIYRYLKVDQKGKLLESLMLKKITCKKTVETFNPLSFVNKDSDEIEICINGSYKGLVGIIKHNGLPTGQKYFLDSQGTVIAQPSSYIIGSCVSNIVNDGGNNVVHSYTNVGNGIYGSPFAANKVKVSYDSSLISVAWNGNLQVRLIGQVIGNGIVAISPNTSEDFTFNGSVITGVEILNSIGACVSVEFLNN
jgi:hypothetical protein